MSYWIAPEYEFLKTQTLMKPLEDNGSGAAQLTITIGPGQDVEGPFLIRLGSSWSTVPTTNFKGFRAVDRVSDYLQDFSLIAQAGVVNFEQGQRVFEHTMLLGFQPGTDTLAASVSLHWNDLTGFMLTPITDTAFVEIIPFTKHGS